MPLAKQVSANTLDRKWSSALHIPVRLGNCRSRKETRWTVKTWCARSSNKVPGVLTLSRFARMEANAILSVVTFNFLDILFSFW